MQNILGLISGFYCNPIWKVKKKKESVYKEGEKGTGKMVLKMVAKNIWGVRRCKNTVF